MKHKPEGACRFSHVAWQSGYDDARFDGINTFSELPCQCRYCKAAYRRGVDEGSRKALEVERIAKSMKAGQA